MRLIEPFVSCALLGALSAQIPHRVAVPPAGATLASAFRGVFVDASRGDGVVWAVGEAYRARIDVSGLCVVPSFGSRASRGYSFALRLQEARHGTTVLATRAPVAPARAAERTFVFQNGPVVERYELLPHGVEQSFTIAERFGDGDLVVRLAVETDLAYRGHEPGIGHAFGADALGTIVFGDAKAIDSAGRELEFTPRWTAGRLELRVPAAFADAASYPLTIDPLIAARPIDTGPRDSTAPDIAYDPINDLWTVVWEERFDATDRNLMVRRVRSDGSVLDTTFAEATTNDAQGPRVAGNAGAQQSLFVWIETDAVSSQKRAMSRLRASNGGQYGAAVALSGATNPSEVVVGGTALPGATSYLTAWIEGSAPSSTIRTRLVGTNGSLAGVGMLEPAAGCLSQLALNRSTTKRADWCLTWVRKSAVGFLCVQGDIFFGVVRADATIDQPPAPLDGQAGADLAPSVAGDGEQFIVVWEHELSASQADIMGGLIRRAANGSYAKIGATRNYSVLEPNVVPATDKRAPQIAFDGSRFAYVYLDGASPRIPHAATLGIVGSGEVFYAGHEKLTGSTRGTSAPAFASRGASGGPPVECFAVWQQLEPATSLRDIHGALYEARSASGGVVMLPGHCSKTAPMTLSVSPAPAPGVPLQVTLTAASVPTALFIGPEIAPQPLCSATFGVCRLRVSALLTVNGTIFAATVPHDLSLVGAKIGFQGVMVGAGSCPATIFGVQFETSDAAIVTFQ